MGKVIYKTNIKRMSGLLYFCGTSQDGFLTICEAKMVHGRKKGSKKKVKPAKKKTAIKKKK